MGRKRGGTGRIARSGGTTGCRSLLTLPGRCCTPGAGHGARGRHASDRRRTIPDGAPAACRGGVGLGQLPVWPGYSSSESLPEAA